MSSEESQIKLTVTNLSEFTHIKVNPSATIAEVTNLASKELPNIEFLTYQGDLIQPYSTLSSLGITLSGATLTSKIRINIFDSNLQKSESIILSPHLTFDNLMQLYFQKADRAPRQNIELKIGEIILLPDDIIGKQIQENDSVISLKVNNFYINIEDKTGELFKDYIEMKATSVRKLDDNKVAIEVNDSFTLFNIRDILFSATKTEIKSDFKFFFNKKTIFENAPIWIYKIEEGSTVEVKKSEESIQCAYECYGCKVEVRLTKRDKVICKRCFGRVLFKKANGKKRVYNCR